jgi:putative PIN family toxin of toxin-antitoxin system
LRAVIDTNILVSGLIRKQGLPGQVLRHLRSGDFTLIYSVPIMVEVVEVLSRPQFRHKYQVVADDITALINLVRLRGELVTPNRKIDVCRDPKDNRFLEAAIEGDADIIVSGDKDLLDMADFETIPIVSTAEFLARL